MPEFGFRVEADLNDDEDRILVRFPYHKLAVRAAKRVPGHRFVPPDKGGPHWLFPRDLTTARMLREQFGEELDLGAKLRKWAKGAVTEESKLIELANADDAELSVVPDRNPELYKYLRPYQRAGAAMMAVKSIINADEPGLGKTVQTIASLYERDVLDSGGHLIVAPKTSLSSVWLAELELWAPDLPVIVASGDDTPDERQELVDLAVEFAEDGTPFALVMNPAFIRWQRDKTAEKILVDGHLEYPMIPIYPELFDIEWATVVFDEYHLMGLSNPKTNMFRAANKLKSDHKVLLSGTPTGGKPVKLWGALHFIEPESFTSKWRWVDQWLDKEEETVYTSGGERKVVHVHGVRSERQASFDQHLNPHMVRRTKREVAPELPPIDKHDVWCDMTPRQQKQYDTFAANAEIKIEEENLSATGILAEYMRLKQFACARQQVKHMANGELKVKPTTDSGKLPQLMRILEERGIVPEKQKDDAWGDAQVVVASQFSSIVDMIHEYLNSQGIKAEKITGAVTQKHREELIREFQAEESPTRVMVLTTTAGGVSITLDKADTVVVMDETWVPDDQDQVINRVHRISRIHNVTAFFLRSRHSIEEYIEELVRDKANINTQILDLRRAGFRAIRQQEVAA